MFWNCTASQGKPFPPLPLVFILEGRVGFTPVGACYSFLSVSRGIICLFCFLLDSVSYIFSIVLYEISFCVVFLN